MNELENEETPFWTKEGHDRALGYNFNLIIDPKDQRIVDLEKQVATLWLAIADQAKRIGLLEVRGEK